MNPHVCMHTQSYTHTHTRTHHAAATLPEALAAHRQTLTRTPQTGKRRETWRRGKRFHCFFFFLFHWDQQLVSLSLPFLLLLLSLSLALSLCHPPSLSLCHPSPSLSFSFSLSLFLFLCASSSVSLSHYETHVKYIPPPRCTVNNLSSLSCVSHKHI